jgi:hypothetical protein
MEHLAGQGTRISTCGTCLDYFGRSDKLIVGERGNMRDTVRAMLTYKKILGP